MDEHVKPTFSSRPLDFPAAKRKADANTSDTSTLHIEFERISWDQNPIVMIDRIIIRHPTWLQSDRGVVRLYHALRERNECISSSPSRCTIVLGQSGYLQHLMLNFLMLA